MTSAFKVMQDAIVTALLQAPQIVGSRVYAGRGRSLPTDQSADIVVAIDAIDGEQFVVGGNPVRWDVRYAVEIRCRGSESVDAVSACDPLLESVFARLAATTPPAGVEGFVLQPRVGIDLEEAATPIATCVLWMTASMRTQPGTLTLAA